MLPALRRGARESDALRSAGSWLGWRDCLTTLNVGSAPRVIRTPDLLIRRTVRARQHPTTIGHSTAHNPMSDQWNSACPSQASGGSRDASAPHVVGQGATAMQ